MKAIKFKYIFKEILSYILIFAVVFGLTKLFTHFVASPFIVSGRSMDYTLQDRERMLMLHWREIDRFDVVVLPSPLEEKKLFIKRVIGLPGDTVEFKDDHLVLNGIPTKEPYLAPKEAEWQAEGNLDSFTRPWKLTDIGEPEVIPEGQVLIVGDNRRNSSDGRNLGLVPLDSLIAEADYIYWPLNKFGSLTKYELDSQGQIVEVD